MSARSRQTNDDLSLSLTGSQIHSASGSRPSSAKQLKRPNSVSDIRTKERKGKPGQPGKKADGASGDADGISHRSGISDVSSVSKASSRKGRSPGDDFLALFESSVQPKIKGSSGKSRKPSANAVKVVWGEPTNPPPLKNKFVPKAHNKGPPGGGEGFDEGGDWANSHSIFQQHSARSSSDEEEVKGHRSQSFSGSYGAAGKNNVPDRHPSVGSKEQGSSGGRQLYREAQDDGSLHVNKHSSGQSGIANNMTLQGMSPGIKVGLSSLENSYQNIKHKTPINQVRKTSSTSQGANNLAEDYINNLNQAATTIQRWFRRHMARVKAGRAAMHRLFGQKKQMFEQQRLRESQDNFMDVNAEERRQEERKRIREEKAKVARQHAIQDLQKKREEKRQDVKKKAEQEIAFLHASGKITKAPLKTGLGKKKGASKPDGKKSATQDSNINTHQDSSPERDKREANDNSLEDYYLDGMNDSRAAESQPGSSRTPRLMSEDGGGDTLRGTVKESKSVAGTTEVTTKSTLDDLFETLKKLEEEEHLVSARPNKKNSWLDDLDKIKDDDEDSHSLNAENLQRLNHQKLDIPTKSSLLSDDKMKSIMAFLDEVQVADRLSSVDQEISKISVDFERPPALGPSAEELAELDQANKAASEVTNKVLSQRLELDEKGRTVTMLQRALNQQRELTVRHAKETEKEMKKRLDLQKDEYEETIKRHLGFIDQLIDDKKSLGEKCENLVKELKTVDKKYQDKLKNVTEKHSLEMQKLKDMHEAAEKLRREKWIEDKTKKIKEMTVKGLEPEIQRLIAKHKGDLKKVKQIHEAELLEADERAAQRYVKMTEELRDQLAEEKEAACARERELAKQRYEKQVRQEEDAYQQQRRRLMVEIQEEKDRLAQQASRQRADLDKLQRQLEDTHSHALEAMKSEFEKAREEQDRRHATEIREMKERMDLEKEVWEENYRKKQENWLMSKERQLKEGVKKERNKEIELVIRQLEEDATAAREDCERVAENRIKRIREKYDSEMREMERSERQAMERYNEMKARLTEVEGENECQKVHQKQKDQEIFDLKKLTEKMHRERDRVSDIIRQEFADRLVFTDEENKRIKNEISELRAKQRIEVQKAKDEIEDIKKQKDEEMEEVHKRVKEAIVKKEEVVTQLKQQYQAALKRADHLEGLLQQQRKQLLGK